MNKKFQGLGAKLPSRPRAAARIRQTTRQSAYIAAILMGLSTSAHAQWAVFDAANFSQNVMTAARELQQINNQIQSLQKPSHPRGEGRGDDPGVGGKMIQKRQACHGVKEPVPVTRSSVAAVARSISPPSAHDAGGIAADEFTASNTEVMKSGIGFISLLGKCGLSHQTSHGIPRHKRSPTENSVLYFRPKDWPRLKSVLPQSAFFQQGIFGKNGAGLSGQEKPPLCGSILEGLKSRIKA